jgi:hypothetical protein
MKKTISLQGGVEEVRKEIKELLKWHSHSACWVSWLGMMSPILREVGVTDTRSHLWNTGFSLYLSVCSSEIVCLIGMPYLCSCSSPLLTNPSSSLTHSYWSPWRQAASHMPRKGCCNSVCFPTVTLTDSECVCHTSVQSPSPLWEFNPEIPGKSSIV